MADTFNPTDIPVVPAAMGKTSKGAPKELTPLQRKTESAASSAPTGFPEGLKAAPSLQTHLPTAEERIRTDEAVAEVEAFQSATPFADAFKSSVGGYARDIYRAATRETARKDLDPNWDAGVHRSEFRKKYPMEHWEQLEATKNRDQYTRLLAVLDEKAERERVQGESIGGTLTGSLLDPVGLLTGGLAVKGAISAARAYKLSKVAALAGGAVVEGGTYAAIEAGVQTSEFGEVYNERQVAQTFAIAGALHFGLGAALTPKSMYAAKEVQPRVEPYIGTPERLEADGVAEADSIIGTARQELADHHQRVADDIAKAGNMLEPGTVRNLKAEGKQAAHSLKYFDQTFTDTFKVRAKELQGTGLSRSEAEAVARKELTDARINLEGRKAQIEVQLRTHAEAAQAEQRLNLMTKGKLPDVAPESGYPLPKVEAPAQTESALVDGGSAVNSGRATLQDENITKSASEGVVDWQDTLTRDDEAFRSIVGDKAFDWLKSTHGKTSALFSNTLRGFSSASPIVRATARIYGEDPTGVFRAGGRATAIDKASYNNAMRGAYSGVHDEYRGWLKRTGNGGVVDRMTGKLEVEFNKALRSEMEARWNSRHLDKAEQDALDAARWANTPAEIRRAADALDAGNQKALDLMKKYNVLGAEGLDDVSRGYVPRRMNGKFLQDLQRTNPARFTQIESALGRRFFESFTATQRALIAAGEQDVRLITPEKAQTIARGMMDRAINRASGMDGSTIGLLDRAAREEIRNALESKGLDYADIEHTFKLLDKRLGQRTGSNRLKGRMEVDISTPIDITVDGKTETVNLQDLFDNDLNRLMYSYAEEMSGRIALARQGINSDNDFEQILNVVKNENKSEDVAKDIQLLRDMHSIMLGRPLEGQGQNKVVQTLTQLNPLQSLGQVGWAQATESSLSVARLGVGAFLKAVPMAARLVVGARKGMLSESDAAILRDIESLNGPIGEFWRTHRPTTDVMERLNSDGQIAHMADRMLKAGQHINGFVSFMHQIMEAQLKTTAVLGTRSFAKEIMQGNLTKRVADAGWTQESMAAVKRQLEKHATFEKGELVDLNAKAWTDQSALDEFARNIERLSGQLVQRDFAGETASWMHKDMGRLFLSLRGYSIKAFNKQFTRNVKIADAVAAQSVVMGLAFSTLGYTARMHAMSAFREDREEFLEERLSGGALVQGAVGYMALGSFGPELMRPLASWYAEGNGDSSIRSGANAVVAVLPGLAPLERATTVLGDIGSSVIGGQDWSAARTRHLVQFFLGNSAPVALALNASVDDSE